MKGRWRKRHRNHAGRPLQPHLSPLFEDSNSESALEILKAFVDKCRDQEPKNAVYIQLPDDKSALIALLRKSGFRYESEWYRTFVTEPGLDDREAMGQVWIVRNDSSVPAQPSFTHTGRVTLYTTVANDVYDPIGYFLMVKGKRIPAKMFPGGTANPGETSIATALRELEEELGLHFEDKSQFRLLSVIEREPKSDSQGIKTAGDTTFYYGLAISEGQRQSIELKLNMNELSWAGWVHWKDLLDDPEVGEQYKMMIKNIVWGKSDSEPFNVASPDFHTLYRSPQREEAAKIWSEKMNVTLTIEKSIENMSQ